MIGSRTSYSAGIVLACIAGVAFADGEQLKVAAYNVESGDAEAAVVAERIAAIDGVDLWGMSEVHEPAWLDAFEVAAEVGEDADFRQILGSTARNDRLGILYDADRLELRASIELHAINALGRVRAPLAGRFRLRSTGQEFLCVVNHLYRSRAEQRR